MQPTLTLPDFALIVLIGEDGPLRDAFARRHFDAAERVATEPGTRSATALAERRLEQRRLTLVENDRFDADGRHHWLQIARRWHAPCVAIVLGDGVDLINKVERKRFDRIVDLSQIEDIAAVTAAFEPLAEDRRADTGPFDIIGDAHGCAHELEALIAKLGHTLIWEEEDGERAARIRPANGRRIALLGDLVDRGPRSPDCVRIAMGVVQAGGYCVLGNHDDKYRRWLEGRDVEVRAGLERTAAQTAGESAAFKSAARDFLEGLPTHLWLDGGRLVLAHAGIRKGMIGRRSKAVRGYAMFGEPTGELDYRGLPIRADWAQTYSGSPAIVYGHTPVEDPEWVNNTLCIDTGCVFGGALTALRWPERELVQVEAQRVHYERPPRIVSGSQGTKP